MVNRKSKSSKTTATIDLNVIHNPNREIIARYDKSPDLWSHVRVSDDFYLNAAWNGEANFFKMVANAGKPVKHSITAIYRKIIDGREAAWFNEHLESFDFLDNYIDHS